MSYLLYINSTEQQLWRRNKGTWQRWAGEPDDTVWVVTDLPEESFVDIKTPRLLGRDRSAIIARQLAAAFPDTPYRGFLTPSQQDGGLVGKFVPTRQILFGISAKERLDEVLDSIKTPIAGVWPISVLLANFCQRRDLPPDLLVALPGTDTLRIVYLRQRSPLLARLTATPNQANAQVEELIRTLRYLENSQNLNRERRVNAVLFLGDSPSIEGLIAGAGLNPLKLQGKNLPPADWRFPVFDLTLKSPPGQVAPLERRVTYLSARLRKAALIASGVAFAVAVAVAGVNTYSLFNIAAQKQSIATSMQQFAAQLDAVEQSIAKFGIAPDVVRQAIALDEKEIISIPSMESHLRLLADALASDGNLRIANLRWRMLMPTEAACTGTTDAGQTDSATTPGDVVNTSSDARKVEMLFDVAIPESYGPRDRLTAMRNLSARIVKLNGVTLIKDPLKNFTASSLSGGSERGDGRKPLWCFTLPGSNNTSDMNVTGNQVQGTKP